MVVIFYKSLHRTRYWCSKVIVCLESDFTKITSPVLELGHLSLQWIRIEIIIKASKLINSQTPVHLIGTDLEVNLSRNISINIVHFSI